MSGADLAAAVGMALPPPHSAEAEQSLLGCLLTDAQVMDAVAGVVDAGDFYFPDHRAIFSTIAKLAIACQPVDMVTVYEAGGHDLPYLATLMQAMPVLRHARRYAEIVRERSVRRQVMTIARALHDDALAGTEDGKPVPELLDAACGQLLALLTGAQQQSEPTLLADMLGPWLTDLDGRAAGKTDAIATGLPDIDRALDGGLRPGEVVVLAARPSMGKSALALQLARHMSGTTVVGALSMEDSRNMLVSRQVAAAGRINLAHVRRPDRAPDTLWEAVTRATDVLAGLQLYLDDAPALTLQDVRTKANQIRRKAGGLGVLMVDYLQLMEGEGETRAQELTTVARGMKRLAKEMDIPIVLMSQLSRKADETNAPPRLDHLAESGGIEQAADIIGLLWRECRRNPRPGNEHSAQVEFVKNKNGPTCTVQLHFDGAVQRFTSVSHDEGSEAYHG